MKLGARALVLFATVGVAPVVIVVALLVSVNQRAVITTEQQLQAATIDELKRLALRRIEIVHDDANAVAFALGEAARAPAPPPGSDGLEVVRAILASRQGIDAVRFEVPASKVSTVIRRQDEGTATIDIPSSTPDLQRIADERGVAVALAARSVSKPIVRLAKHARQLGERKWRDVSLESTRSDEIGDLTREFSSMAKDLEESEALIIRQAKQRADLGRFLSKELVDAIVSGKHELSLGGRRATVSVLFADVVAFTPLAETKQAEEVVSILNELFSILTEVVFRHGGTVDKFIGDCIMAVWGAPVEQADHAQRALAAAEDMMRFLETANESFRERYGVTLELGIGINSGEVLVGNIGSDKRMEYTVIGDAVNVAARLEAIARPNQVLLAESTWELAQDEFDINYLGERTVTGRKNLTKVYELVVS